MALDLGELVARLKADSSDLDRGLLEVPRKMRSAGQAGAFALERESEIGGERGSRSLVSGLTSALPGLGGAIVPILGAVGVAGGAVLGAGIAAAVIAAVPLMLGGGVLAAGIMAAAKDPAVKAAFAPLGKQGGEVLKQFAEPFKGPLIRAAKTFGDALAKIAPYLQAMGTAMAPIIDRFAPVLADMAVRAMPGILRAVQASVPLFEGMAGALGRANVGGWISKVIGGIAALVPWAMKVGGVFLAIGGFIATQVIPPLRELAGTWLAEARKQFSGVAASLRENEPQLRTFVHWIGQAAAWARDHLVPILKSQLVTNLKIAGNTFKFVIGTISAFVTAVQAVVGATQRTVNAVKNGVHDIRSFFSNLPGQIGSALAGLPGAMYSAGRHIISMLGDGIKAGAQAVVNSVKSIVSGISNLIPHSPVKEGPLRSLNNGRAGRQIASMLADGIRGGAPLVHGAFTHLVDVPRATMSPGVPRGGFGRGTPPPAQVIFRIDGSNDLFAKAIRGSVRVVGQGSAQSGLGTVSVPVQVMG